MERTKYTEVTAADRDVAAFIAGHKEAVNLLKLPVKMWVARCDGEIIAVLMLKTAPYLSVDLIVAHPQTRPFMRIMKLYRVAEAWLVAHAVPIICISIRNDSPHFQTIIQRLGYKKAGEESDADGYPIETIYSKELNAPALPKEAA